MSEYDDGNEKVNNGMTTNRPGWLLLTFVFTCKANKCPRQKTRKRKNMDCKMTIKKVKSSISHGDEDS